MSPKGGRWWRFKYHFEGKQKRPSLGTYPDVTLKQARERRDELRAQVANGIDPSAVRKAEKRSEAGQDSFEVVTREQHEKFKHNWSVKHAEETLKRFEKEIFPWIGKKNINDVKAAELLATLRRIESRGALYSAHRVHQQHNIL